MGYENIAGYLDGGFDAWKAANLPVEPFKSVKTEDDFKKAAAQRGMKVVDIRAPGEIKDTGKVKGAANYPLNIIENYLD